MDKQFLFVSYSMQDREGILPLVTAVNEELSLRAIPVELWMDMSHLQPGEQWEVAIADALERSVGFLFFVSPRSMNSEFVRHELEFAAAGSDRLIIPVILHETPDLPKALAERQWITFTGQPTREETLDAATRIADVTEAFLKSTPKPKAIVSAAKAPSIAFGIAEGFRAAEPVVTETKLNSVFVVHGHNEQALGMLEEYLVSVGVTAVVLSRLDKSPQSLFQKFMTVATEARFAIVLLSADDYGASLRQFDAKGVGERALQFRARQNVVLELGFFYGRLGWENVFVVQKEPEPVFPNFERPSDLDGVVFASMSDAAWQANLGKKLADAGFNLTPPV